jgi:hypothetical protein
MPLTYRFLTPRTLNMEWRKWKGKQKRGNALALPSPHERVLPTTPPAEPVINGHLGIRIVAIRTVHEVLGGHTYSTGMRIHTQNTSLLTSPTSALGSENYFEN